MKTILKTSMLAAGLLAAVIGCDGTSNKDPIANAKEASDDKDLQSKIFRGDCDVKVVARIVSALATGGEAAVRSSRDQWQFVGANVTYTTHFYQSENCEGQEVLTYKETGEFDVDKDNRGADKSKFISMKMEKVTLQANNEAGAKVANELKLCGREDWSNGKEENVTDKSNDLKCYHKQVPSEEANVYRIDNNALYFGLHGKKAEDRPSRVNPLVKYIAE